MRWSDPRLRPSDRILRQFAGLWILFFTGLACWNYFVRGSTPLAVLFVVLALTAGPLGLVWPRALRPVYVGWMLLALPIGHVVSFLILGLLFYLLIAPLGLFFRLVGRDALCLRQRPGQLTYWAAKPGAPALRNYFQQF